MKKFNYFKSFRKFAVGYSKSTNSLWWHNINPRKLKDKKYDSTRWDTLISFARMYNRDKKLYTYHITFFSRSIIIGPFRRK